MMTSSSTTSSKSESTSTTTLVLTALWAGQTPYEGLRQKTTLDVTRSRQSQNSAGGGTRTPKLSRAPAPKTGVFAISPRPRSGHRKGGRSAGPPEDRRRRRGSCFLCAQGRAKRGLRSKERDQTRPLVRLALR